MGIFGAMTTLRERSFPSKLFQMDALQERVAALKALALRRPRADRLREVRDALENKFEGVQGAAVKVLGAWGDDDSCKLLRAFLERAFDRRYGWSIRGVAIKALVPHVGKGDVDWVLALYFGLPDVVTKHEVLPLVPALPPEAARKRLVRSLRDTVPANRQAAVKAIANMAYQDRLQLISPLQDDSDDFVRDSVQLLMSRK
jgi:HEAT repeat protein